MTLCIRDVLKRYGIEYFLPTETVTRQVSGNRQRVERPIALNLLFVRGDKRDIDSFLACEPKFKLHYLLASHSSHSRTEFHASTPMKVEDDAMRAFMIAIGQYVDTQAPYLKPDEAMLQEGDHVRIIGGVFDGIEGVLLSTQGKSGGRVLISVSGVLAVPTMHIEPEFLQVLRFGNGKKHFYKQMDSYVKRLDVLLSRTVCSDKELQPVRVFVKRFSSLRTETNAAELRLKSILFASHLLLGEKSQAEEIRQWIYDSGLMDKVTERNQQQAAQYLDITL